MYYTYLLSAILQWIEYYMFVDFIIFSKEMKKQL